MICTRNRAASLGETLRCLAAAERGGLRCEIVVVNNGGTDCAWCARAFAPALMVRVLDEPRPGKAHALNRALEAAPLGQIVAIMDDDMSPECGWFAGVKAICDRWPDKDIFTGRTPVIWPAGAVPAWCRRGSLRGWALSSVDAGAREQVLANGLWFPGGHFWVRARVFADGRRFEDIWTTEPQFMLQLVEDGFGGVMAPDAVCGHRVQPELLRVEALRERAARVGRGFAVARLWPYKRTVKQSRLFRQHPAWSRVYCVASVVGWGVALLWSRLQVTSAARIEHRLHAIERLATYREYLRVAARMQEYRLGRHHL